MRTYTLEEVSIANCICKQMWNKGQDIGTLRALVYAEQFIKSSYNQPQYALDTCIENFIEGEKINVI